MQAASSESGLPARSIAASTCRAVTIPSPVVLWSAKITWPDCSPPRAYPPWSISSRTHRSPTGVRTTVMPASRMATSRPTLLITVATTVRPGRRPSASMSRAHRARI